MKGYSIKKGAWKMIVGVLTSALTIITFAGFADVSLWALLETYLKPILGAITVGGALLSALNLAKFKLRG